MQGQPMLVMNEDAERMQNENAQSHNISAARAVADSVQSTLGPKGMDKMLVDSLGDVTITNDGVTILDEMDIEDPTAEMIVEVAETQEDQAGDGTTSAVAIAGELLKNAEDLLDQDIHPTAIIGGFQLGAERAREEIGNITHTVDSDDVETLQKVAETSMTGKGTEVNKELIAELVVEAVQGVTVEQEDGGSVADVEYVNIETQTGGGVRDSELVSGAVVDKVPVHSEMPTEVEDAQFLLLDQPIEVEETNVDAEISVDDPSQLQSFLDEEEEQLQEMVETIADSGANVVLCQKGIDDLAQHYLAREGILAVRRVKKSDLEFLPEVLDAPIVSDLDTVSEDDLGEGSISHRGDEDGPLYIEGNGSGHGVTLLLKGSTDHVVNELERGVQDALTVVAQTVTDGRVLSGGGAPEVEVASRVRNYADGVEGREQLAVETFADALELIPRTLAENAGLDPIDTLVDLRAAHEDGQENAGLDVFTGDVVDTRDAGVIEPAHAKEQAVSSAQEAANLVLKIDDIIQAGEDEDAGGPGGAPGGGMGGMGGMGGAM
jgi:thermosome